jgi:hypothetical protein
MIQLSITWLKYILKIKDYNIINIEIIFLDLEKPSKDLIELISKIVLN